MLLSLIEYAINRGNLKIVKLLVQSGLEIDIAIINNQSALYLAAKKEKAIIFSQLEPVSTITVVATDHTISVATLHF